MFFLSASWLGCLTRKQERHTNSSGCLGNTRSLPSVLSSWSVASSSSGSSSTTRRSLRMTSRLASTSSSSGSSSSSSSSPSPDFSTTAAGDAVRISSTSASASSSSSSRTTRSSSSSASGSTSISSSASRRRCRRRGRPPRPPHRPRLRGPRPPRLRLWLSSWSPLCRGSIDGSRDRSIAVKRPPVRVRSDRVGGPGRAGPGVFGAISQARVARQATRSLLDPQGQSPPLTAHPPLLLQCFLLFSNVRGVGDCAVH